MLRIRWKKSKSQVGQFDGSLLAIKRAARLNTQKEEYAGMKSVNSESTMELTQDAAEEMGMKPYYLYRQKT